MDDPITDVFYYFTVGTPTRKLSKKEKLTEAWDRVLRVVFNVHDTKTIPSQESKSNTDTTHVTHITQLYEHVVLKYFSDRKYVLDLTEECRDMRRQLYEEGELERVSLLYPDIADAKRGTTNIICIKGKGSGGSVEIGQNAVSVVHSGTHYKLSDVLIGFLDGTIHIFKAESLNNIDMTANLTPINWNMPLHTQVYRFFNPSSFDISEIKATQTMIAEHGLEYVVKLFVKSHLKV